MFNDESQEVDLVTSTEEAEEDTETEGEEERGIEYWKAEALKNKAILERNKNKETTREVVKEEKKSDDFGYDVKAYLKASGINANEFDFVKAEMKASGKDIDALLESKYFQEALETKRSLDKTANATIKGKRSGSTATDSVEYWATKDFADVPMNMRGKVIAHREAQEKNRGVFYNS